MQIRKVANGNERITALSLALSVFMEFEAPDYVEQGINTFKDFVQNKEMTDNLDIYAAIDHGNVVGVIATRNEGNHIALFFVDGKLHRNGIGKKLFQIVLENSTAEKITVNASPYAVEIYRHLGFVELDKEQLTDGIRYIQMVYNK